MYCLPQQESWFEAQSKSGYSLVMLKCCLEVGPNLW
jgi:hypothetical protein